MVEANLERIDSSVSTAPDLGAEFHSARVERHPVPDVVDPAEVPARGLDGEAEGQVVRLAGLKTQFEGGR